MCMTVLANHLLSVLGWRNTYLVLAVPMLVVAAPVQLAFVRGLYLDVLPSRIDPVRRLG